MLQLFVSLASSATVSLHCQTVGKELDYSTKRKVSGVKK